MTYRLHQAALFATFYCDKAGPRFGLLTNALMQSDTLNLSQHPANPAMLVNDATGEMMWSFHPNQAHDAAVIQLALNGASDDDACDAWNVCRNRLHAIVPHDLLASDDVWGYTLIYQAVWQDIARPDPLPDLRDIVRHARRLGASEAEAPRGILARNRYGANGDIVLLDVPTRNGEGYAAASIYLALAPADPATANDELVGTYLLGPAATLLMPDLLAHKGYFMMRQYRTAQRTERYKQVIHNVHTEAIKILGTTTPPPQATATSRQSAQRSDLADLFDEYIALLRLVPTFKRLRSGLTEQVENSTRLARRRERAPELSAAGADEQTRTIEAYHLSNLTYGVTELDMMIAQGQDMIDASSKAVDLVQAQAEKASAAQQERIATLLAVLGVALAVPQIVSWDVARHIVQARWHIEITGNETSSLVFLPVLVQVIIMLMCLAIGVLIWRGVKYVQRTRG